ncbi:hypothetical protein SAMN02745857_03329 [Andreprevotia lacus DSM 23236]|jgi:hypothetical protein|uniref:Uncharacterized protein n=1 Tax=Andreprevotia lacus DSM 23236 TaxID=1121001 RepID=A0A1W1XXB9_9NEIS|nr:hypothetical protein [Andreprevotia lacus]SMC28583.1 hypothetical protein SAMN02745857_03329 [Andreprevotia lacus DSM 23236]
MKTLLLAVFMLGTLVSAQARLLPPSRVHKTVATTQPDPAMVRVLPASMLPKDAIVPVQSVARALQQEMPVMAKPPAAVAAPAAAARRDEGPQWIPLSSEQRWQQYSYP